MKKNKIILIIITIILLVVGILFYIRLTNNNTDKSGLDDKDFWYSNNLFDKSEFAMRVIGTNCSSRYVYFYKNRVMVVDWEDTEQEPVVLDVIYYKNKPNLEEYINYVLEENISLNLHNDDNDEVLDKTYYGLYQVFEQANTLYLEIDDIKTKDLLSTISEKDLFNCYE